MLLHSRQRNSINSKSAFCTHSVVCSLHFVPSLHFVSGLQSALCILYWQVSVAPTQFNVGYSYSHNTHNLPCTKIPVCELIRRFRYFRVNTFSFCKNVDVTHNVSSNPPTSKKKILACIPCLCFKVCWRYLLYSGGSPYPRMDGRKIANLLQEGYRMPKPQHVDAKLYDNVFLLFPDGFYRTLVFVRLFVWVACAH